MAEFHFLRPLWLIALLPLIVLMWQLWKRPKREDGWSEVIAPHLLKFALGEQKRAQNKTSLWLTLGIVGILGIVAAAGPTYERLPQPVFSVNQGHVLVMDMSLSMRSTDVAPDRLTRSRFKAIDLVNNLGDGEVGVVAYAGDAFTISPLTSDTNTITALVPSLTPEIMPVEGSDPILGFEQAFTLLKQSGYPNGALYWITDGVDAATLLEVQEWLRENPVTLNVLAIGTEEGAPIKLTNGDFLTDSAGTIVVPKLNYRALRSLSSLGKHRVTRLTADDSDIALLSKPQALVEIEQQENGEKQYAGDQWHEIGPLLVWLVLPIVLYVFSRGVIVSLALVMLAGTGMAPTPAFAKEEASTTTRSQQLLEKAQSWFRNADQQGYNDYTKQRYSDAANHFDDPSWQGAAHYRNGDFEAAAESFAQLDTVHSWYNQGNALAKLNRIDDAIQAYEKALERQPDFTQAEKNKKLLEDLQQQSQQNQNQQGEGSSDQSQENDQNQDSEQNQQSEQQQNSDSSQNQNGDNSQQTNADQTASPDNQNNEQNEQSDEQSRSSQQNQSDAPQDNKQQQPQAPQEPEEQSKNDNDSAGVAAMESEQELTDEEREKQRQLEALLRKIPNDPAFLLQRKMLLESRKRRQRKQYFNQEKQW